MFASDIEQMNASKRYKLTIVIVDRTVITERDGVRTVQTPWAENKSCFLGNSKSWSFGLWVFLLRNKTV
jgi:hypothetical protein